MKCFERLGILETKDIRKIKGAYAGMIRSCHPEEDPEGFLQINQAYKQALQYARTGDQNPEEMAGVKEVPEGICQDPEEMAGAKPDLDLDLDSEEYTQTEGKPEEEGEAFAREESIDFDSIFLEEDKRKAEYLNETIREFHMLFRNTTDIRKLKAFFQSKGFKEQRYHTELLTNIVDFFERNWNLDIDLWRYVKTVLEEGESADNSYQWLLKRYLTAYKKREEVWKQIRKDRWKRIRYLGAGAAFVLLMIFSGGFGRMSIKTGREEGGKDLKTEVWMLRADMHIPERKMLNLDMLFMEDGEAFIGKRASGEDSFYAREEGNGFYSLELKEYHEEEEGISYDLTYPELGDTKGERMNSVLLIKACETARMHALEHIAEYGRQDGAHIQVKGKCYITMNSETRLSIVFLNEIVVNETGTDENSSYGTTGEDREDVWENAYQRVHTGNYLVRESEGMYLPVEAHIGTFFSLEEGKEPEGVQFYLCSYGFIFVKELPGSRGEYMEAGIRWDDWLLVYM